MIYKGQKMKKKKGQKYIRKHIKITVTRLL